MTTGVGPRSRGQMHRSCPECLRRSRLLALLSPYIERSCDDRPGRRVPELLALSNADLVAAVAPRKTDEFLSEVTSIGEGELIEELDTAGCWAICHHHPEWPCGLVHQKDGPRCLIGRGDPEPLLGLEPAASATIVGSRRATSYGAGIARRLGSESARAGLAVVSGMALGIDGAVHRGSLGRGSGDGRSVAVLGGSADRPYPMANLTLYRQLVERGAVVSEMPPGTAPRRWCFPARNRTMASLSGITVVVEAAPRSGSLITAEMALAAGREVGAVPGPVTSGVSAGCHELLKSGAALIRDGFDLVETLAPGLGLSLKEAPVAPGTIEARVLEAIGRGAASADLVASGIGAEVGEVMVALTALEFEGLIEVDVSGRLLATRSGSGG